MIGIFDSGLGGLSVLVEIRRLLPAADLVYVADRARAPYGPRSLAEVRRFAEETCELLASAGASMMVVACNAASAAALSQLRIKHPGTPIVGMEPAIKPAVGATRSLTVGVLTTAATFQGELFASVMDRFADGIAVLPRVCHGWVELVESGSLDGDAAEMLVRSHVEPVIAAGADTLVLGCTHFPFLVPLIRRAAGDDTRIIDPGPAVARQAGRVAAETGLAQGSGQLRFLTTGPIEGLASLVEGLTGLAVSPEPVTLPSS